jgi:TDG/mug DNA glycosylase family protein
VRDNAESCGFEPIARSDATTLILGSLPSQLSLQSGEYFGNPNNVFWKIMGELIDAGPENSYDVRVQRMIAARFAVWDVLRSAVRPGSLDANIDGATAKANDFNKFLQEHTQIERVCFNGQKAAALFERLVIRKGASWNERLSLVTLPSTSPAHASMSFEEKLSEWSVVGRGVRSD